MLPAMSVTAHRHLTDQQVYRNRAAGLRVCDLASPLCNTIYERLLSLLDKPLKDDELGDRAWTAFVMGTTHYRPAVPTDLARQHDMEQLGFDEKSYNK